MKHLIISQIETGGAISQGKLYGIPNKIYDKVITLLNDNSIIEAGTEFDEPDTKPIKSWEEVKVGDIAYHDSCTSIHDKYEGPIVWKGNTRSLEVYHPSDYKELIEESGEDISKTYNQWVIVNLPIYGHTLYNYDQDPSGVKVFK